MIEASAAKVDEASQLVLFVQEMIGPDVSQAGLHQYFAVEPGLKGTNR